MSGPPGVAGPAPASRICLCLTGASLQEDAALLRRERRWVDLVELRADFLEPAELAHLARFPALVDLPVILIVRRVQDGGRWRGAEADRRRLLREALGPAAAGGNGIDVTLRTDDGAFEADVACGGQAILHCSKTRSA